MIDLPLVQTCIETGLVGYRQFLKAAEADCGPLFLYAHSFVILGVAVRSAHYYIWGGFLFENLIFI